MALVGASSFLSNLAIEVAALIPAIAVHSSTLTECSRRWLYAFRRLRKAPEVAVRLPTLTESSRWWLYAFRRLWKAPGGGCTLSDAYGMLPVVALRFS